MSKTLYFAAGAALLTFMMVGPNVLLISGVVGAVILVGKVSSNLSRDKDCAEMKKHVSKLKE